MRDEWGFDVQPDLDGCGEWVRGECGEYLPLPPTVTMPDGGGGGGLEALVLPGEILQPTQNIGFQHVGGHVYEEVTCPDMPLAEYAWIHGELIDGVILRVQ